MILVHFRHRFSKYETQSVPKVNLCFSPDCKNGTVSMLIIRILIHQFPSDVDRRLIIGY